MQPVIYADLRCLQDPKYRVRGIGQHVAGLLRTRAQSAFSSWKIIGLIDPESPELPAECACLVDKVSASWNPGGSNTLAVFIDGSPMTHDTRFSLRFLNHSAFFTAAVVYDFIPLDWPGYLPTVASRIAYTAKLARLQRFSRFFPISEYSGCRLTEYLNVPCQRITVTGASVRNSLYAITRSFEIASFLQNKQALYFLMVSSDDTRKNAEIAVEAVRRLNLHYSQPIGFKIVGHFEGSHKVLGHYGESFKNDLLRLAGHAEDNGFLQFCPNVSDEELVSLFVGAVAAIAPYHIEGFSLPVVEAAVCGCPVIASNCAAHKELIEWTEALFPPDNAAVLCEKLEALLKQPSLRASIAASQAHLGSKFHEHSVGLRFWSGLEDAVKPRKAPAVRGRYKPRLAFLSPYPPDQSGAARFTAMTMRAGKNLFYSDLYSNAARPLAYEGFFRDAGPVSLAPLIDGQYDRVISVLGNSHFHTAVFKIFERYGGPCILHDARLTQIYFHRLGQEKFLKFAARLLHRSVSVEEIHTWLQDQNPPSLFLEPVIQRASPLIVHTATQKNRLKDSYGFDAQLISSCPTHFFTDRELTPSAKQLARDRHGIPPGTFLISTFGIVDKLKGMETCILALELLRSWDIPAALHFVGNATVFKREIDRIAALYGIASHIHSDTRFVDDETYRDFLVASDAAVQLRTYGFGQFSAALADCISAALPCVASSELAASCDAPAYILTVPDRFSPLQVAEQLARIWDMRAGREPHAKARAAYLETHNFQHYVKRLMEVLELS